MVKLEKVKRSHNCHECKQLLYSEGSLRVNFGGSNYCIPCGYFRIKEEIDELERFLSELKNKFTKEIVLERLKR